MNKILLTGRIVKDIELKQTKNNIEYTRFTLAVTRDFKNAQGEYECDFINCIAYKNTANTLANYILKGDKIGIEGRLTTGSYEKDGKKIYTTEVTVEKLEFLQQRQKQNSAENTSEEESKENSIDSIYMDDLEIDGDDLPF